MKKLQNLIHIIKVTSSLLLLGLIVFVELMTSQLVASGNHPQMESEFKAKEGNPIWNHVVDVRILVESVEESLESLKSVLNGQGFDPGQDSEFNKQQKRYKDLRRWQGVLDQHAFVVLVFYRGFW